MVYVLGHFYTFFKEVLPLTLKYHHTISKNLIIFLETNHVFIFLLQLLILLL